MSGCSNPTTKAFTVPAYSGGTTPPPSGQAPASAPSVSAGASTETSVTLNYGQVTGATGYEYNDTAGGDQRFNSYTGSFVLGQLSPGQTIQARARAFNAAGNGPWSNYVTLTAQSAAPAVPGAPNAYDCSANNSSDPETEVVLCWDLVDNAVSYVVQDAYSNPFNVGLRNNAHLSNLPPGTTIWAKVAGVNSAGQQGPWSNVVYMTTAQQQQLATPNVYQCGTVTSTEVDICWDAVSGAYQYEVNNTLGADFSTAGTVAHFTGASPGETFSARVRAVDSQGNYGNWSSYITLQTLSSLYG